MGSHVCKEICNRRGDNVDGMDAQTLRRLQQAADIFVKAWANQSWITDLQSYPAPPKSVAELYETHLAIQQHPLTKTHLGGLGGYKLGAVGALDQPCLYAPLFRRFFVEASLGESISVASIQMHQVEPEFGVFMGADLRARSDGKLHGNNDVWAAIESVVLSIECCGRRSSSDVVNAQSPIGKFADCLSGGGVVLGKRLPRHQLSGPALASCNVSFSINGTVVVEGSGSKCPEQGPLPAVTWLANHLNSRGLALQKGQLVMTGQTCNTRNFKPGDVLTADFAGLGSVQTILQP